MTRTLFSLSDVTAWYLKTKAAPFLKKGVLFIIQMGEKLDVSKHRPNEENEEEMGC